MCDTGIGSAGVIHYCKSSWGGKSKYVFQATAIFVLQHFKNITHLCTLQQHRAFQHRQIITNSTQEQLVWCCICKNVNSQDK